MDSRYGYGIKIGQALSDTLMLVPLPATLQSSEDNQNNNKGIRRKMMALIEELKAKRQQILNEMDTIDAQSAEVRRKQDEQLQELRKKRMPLEENLRLVDQMLKMEGGK